MKNQFFISLLLIVVLCILMPLFFIGGPGGNDARSLKEIWNLGHIFFFAIFAWLILASQRKDGITLKIIFVALCSVAIVGLTIEMIQLLMDNRKADLGDFSRDLVGGLLGVAIAVYSSSNANISWRKKLYGATFFFCLMSFVPLVRATIDEFSALKSFPVLSDFETASELQRWTGKVTRTRVNSPVQSGRFSMQVKFTTKKYSSVVLHYFPRDWRGMQSLSIAVYNPQAEQLWLHYRIHDGYHAEHDYKYDDRFNAKAKLQPGWNRIEATIKDIRQGPRNREMNIADIRGMILFVASEPVEKIIYIDDVRLME